MCLANLSSDSSISNRLSSLEKITLLDQKVVLLLYINEDELIN